MASIPALRDRVSTITDCIAQIDEFLSSTNTPQPSLSLGADPVFQLPADLDRTRQNALDACDELRALLQGPIPHLIGLVTKHGNFSSLQAICKFGIAQQLLQQEIVSFQELAHRCKLDEDNLRRLLRMAIANRVFEEPSKDHVRHNAASAALALSPELSDWIMFVCEEILPASSRMVEAIARYPGSEKPFEAGFSLVNGGNKAFFDVISQDLSRLQRYEGCMRHFHRSAALSVDHLTENLEWGEEYPKLLVDVGGNQGSVCIKLLEKFPFVTGIVEDLPEVVSDAKAPSELASRLSFVPHDLFAEQIVKDADVYLFRWILHDWPDAYAVDVLRQQIPALKHGARLILNEIILPEPGKLTPFQDQSIRGFDLNIKSLHNSKERTEEDWRSLFKAADSRFKIERVRQIPQSLLSIIEVVWQNTS